MSSPLIPKKSPYGAPDQAPYPTARGCSAPPFSWYANVATAARWMNGIPDGLSEPAFAYNDYLSGSAGDNLLAVDNNGNPTGGIAIQGFANKLDCMNRGFTLYGSRQDTFTDFNDSSNDANGTSSISGDGQCPVCNYSNGNTVWMLDRPDFGGGQFPPWFRSGRQWLDINHFNGPGGPSDIGQQTTHSYSDAIPVSSMAADVLAFLITLKLSSTFGGGTGSYNDAPVTGANNDVSSLNPSNYDGSKITYAGANQVPGNNTSNVATLNTVRLSDPGGSFTFSAQKRFLTYTGNITVPFSVLRIQYGLDSNDFVRDISTDLFTRITLLTSGVISKGQTIGCAEDNPTFVIPMALNPLPIAALGTNGIWAEDVTVIFGSLASWLNIQNLHLGDQ